MKIISVDNFDREIPFLSDDALIAENVHQHLGPTMVKALNEQFGGDDAPNFYKLVTDNYQLRTYAP